MSLLQLEGESVIKGNSKADMKHNAKIWKWFEDNKENIDNAFKTALVVIVAGEMLRRLKPEIAKLNRREKEVRVVCGFNSYFSDDVKAQCCICGKIVFHRPYVSKGKKVCVQCML